MNSILNNKQNINLLKILASICFVLVSLSCIFTNSNLVSGYELSIYHSTHLLVWVFLIACISISIFTILHQIYTDQYKINFFWITLFFIILIQCRFILLSVPYIRGYLYPWRGDSLDHVGYVVDILTNGHYAVTDYYPITHIILADLVLCSGVSIEVISKLTTPLLAIVHITFIYLLAKSVFSDKESQIISMVIACLIFNIYDFAVTPNGWSTLYFPLVLSCLFLKSFEYRVIFTIFLILLPLFHVLTATVFIFVLFVFSIINIFYVRIKSKEQVSCYDYFKKFQSKNPIVLESIILSIWILSFKIFNVNIQGVYDLLTRDNTKSFGLILGASEKLDKVGIKGIDVIFLAIKMYGDQFIFIGFAFVSLFILLKNKSKFNLNFFIIIVLFFVFLGQYLLYFFNLLPWFSYIAGHRLLMYLVVFIPISTAYVFKYFKRKDNKICFLICIFLILIASVTSILSLYFSPWVIQPNAQVTHMDINGMGWYYNVSNSSVDPVYIMTLPISYANEILGIRESSNRKISRYYDQIPDHFNYTNHSTFGKSYTEDKYALISEFDKIIYVTVWKHVGRFSSADFQNLEYDITANKIYNNYGFNVWYINDA